MQVSLVSTLLVIQKIILGERALALPACTLRAPEPKVPTQYDYVLYLAIIQ